MRDNGMNDKAILLTSPKHEMSFTYQDKSESNSSKPVHHIYTLTAWDV